MEGAIFITAFIEGISGILRPTFCTTGVSVSFAPALKGCRIRPPAYLAWTSQLCSHLWHTSSGEFTGKVYNLTAPAAYQVPGWMLSSPLHEWQKRTGVCDLMRLKLPSEGASVLLCCPSVISGRGSCRQLAVISDSAAQGTSKDTGQNHKAPSYILRRA